MQKNGKRRGIQRYRCVHCGTQFQGKRRSKCRQLVLWKEYIWDKQSLSQLSEQYGVDIKTIRKRLDAVVPIHRSVESQSLVFVADVSFFSRGDGVLVFRSPRLKRNILWRFVQGENPEMYRNARKELEVQGFVFQGIVLDGRRGVREVFSDIHVQIATSIRNRS